MSLGSQTVSTQSGNRGRFGSALVRRQHLCLLRVIVAAIFSMIGSPVLLRAADLFVSSEITHSVLQYNGTTGAFVTAFVPSGSGGLVGPQGLTFGPNGNLFVCNLAGANSGVLEYDGTTGAFVRAFVPFGSGGLRNPLNLTFGPNGNL